MSRFAVNQSEQSNPLIAAMKRALDSQDELAAFPRTATSIQSNVMRLPNLPTLRTEVALLSSAVAEGVNCAVTIASLMPGEVPSCVDIQLFNDAGSMTVRRLREAQGLLSKCGIADMPSLFANGRNLTGQFKALKKLRQAAIHADPKQWLTA